MKVKVVIIEDELPARTTLKSFLKRYFPQIEVVAEISSLADAKIKLRDTDFDFVFLDVQLKDGLGIELLGQIEENRIRVIFTTAFDEYTLEAFKFKAFGYLLKPIDPMDFQEIVNRVLKDILHTNTSNIKIKVPTARGFAFIDVKRIIRCESESNYTKVYCENNETFIISKTLKTVEKELESTESFIRIHQSHLVNINYIDLHKVGSNHLYLKNESQLPVSRSKKNLLLKVLSRVNSIDQ